MSEQPHRTSAAASLEAESAAPVADHTRLDEPAAGTGSDRANAPLGAHDHIGGRYRLVSPIAAGGMATVWRAVDEVLTRPVAVKILHAHLAADPDFVARFRREAVAAARLAHPSIVAIYDTCSDPEAIVMELVDGRTLRAELDERGFLPPDEAASIAGGIAQALEVAHKAGLVHRDVKPANVLLAPDGQLKVADFGIAKAARGGDESSEHPELPDLTSMGLMVGTAKYLAPEQVSGGPVDARTDVYALGAVLYEMLCGRPPFAGSNDLATATARLHAAPERPRSVLRTIPPAVDAIVMKALATDPTDRYPSASAMWADLQTVAHRDEAAARPPVTDATAVVRQQQSFARSERSWLVPVSLVSLVAVALGLAWVLIGGSDARRDLIDLVDRVSPGRTASADPAPPRTMVASAYDPLGDGKEHHAEAGFAVAGGPATGWTTQRYESRAFGGLKSGVGLVVDLDDATQLETLQLDTPNAGWSATIHVGDQAPADHAEWSSPVATVDDAAAGTTTLDLDGAEGSFVLIWLTDLGTGGGVQFDLREVRFND